MAALTLGAASTPTAASNLSGGSGGSGGSDSGTIFECRGRVFVFSGAASASFHRLDPEIESDDKSPVLIISVDTSDSAAVTPLSALNDHRILYLHGRNFAPISINGMVLLGSGETGYSSGYKAVTDWFETNVVTTLEEPVSVSGPGDFALKVYVLGLNWGSTDPNFHIKPFVISGLVANIPTRD